MSSAPDTKELEFAGKIRRALDESTAGLPAATLERLAGARRLALARKKPEPVAVPAFVPVLAHAGADAGAAFDVPPAGERRGSPLARILRIWPVVALIGGIAVIAYWENLQRSAELADIDAAMLSDELPLNAYLDHGFNAYLSRAR